MNSQIFPITEETFYLPGPAGRLEVLATPGELNAPTAIICHPHPQKSGTMHNKVVTTLHRALWSQGLNTVRFNFRGVGQSEGEYGNKEGELADLKAVLAWAQTAVPNPAFYLAGFSFGAYIAYRLAAELSQDPHLRQLITVGMPVHYEVFLEVPPPTCPWLFLQGDRDEVIDPTAVYAWLDQLAKPPRLIRFAEAGHFFHGKLLELRDAISSELVA